MQFKWEIIGLRSVREYGDACLVVYMRRLCDFVLYIFLFSRLLDFFDGIGFRVSVDWNSRILGLSHPSVIAKAFLDM